MTIEEIYKRIFKNFKILGLGKILSGLFSALTIFVLAQYELKNSNYHFNSRGHEYNFKFKNMGSNH